MRFYDDNALLHSEPITGSVFNSDYDLTIGVLPHDDINTYGSFFEGSIDYFHLWDKALEYNEIMGYNNNSLVGNESGLVGFWNFSSGSGDILYDYSGNQNHGTIVGASWEEVVSGCTDTYAENYNSDANMDDGSCTYPDNGSHALSFNESKIMFNFLEMD